MKPEDKNKAEKVLNYLRQGAQIDGIRFGPILQVLITDHASGKKPIRGQFTLTSAQNGHYLILCRSNSHKTKMILPTRQLKKIYKPSVTFEKFRFPRLKWEVIHRTSSFI